jgi:uncharacterized membrane protein YhaH (DUF805 family)
MVAAGLLAGFMLLVASATIRYSEAPYITYNTTAGIVDHLTLGIISPDLRYAPDSSAGKSLDSSDETFVTEGLVEASGNDRLGAAKIALNAWRQPANLLLGVGLGNLGPYVVANIDSSAPSNLTVYIFYVLFLVEMGILGLLLLFTLYAVAVRRLYRQHNEDAWIVLLILVGFLTQYFFFGSYINATYIWLWLGVGLGLGVELSHKHDKTIKTKRRTVSKV